MLCCYCYEKDKRKRRKRKDRNHKGEEDKSRKEQNDKRSMSCQYCISRSKTLSIIVCSGETPLIDSSLTGSLLVNLGF